MILKTPTLRIEEEREFASTIPAHKQMIYFLIITVSMLFAGITSAVIVSIGDGHWNKMEFPTVLWFSTAIILLSTFSIEFSKKLLHQNERQKSLSWLLVTGILGLIFLICQYFAFVSLAASGFFVDTNISISYFYLICILHGLHIVGILSGLSYVVSMTNQTKRSQPSLMANLATFWHFLTGLWIYLIVFLYIVQI